MDRDNNTNEIKLSSTSKHQGSYATLSKNHDNFQHIYWSDQQLQEEKTMTSTAEFLNKRNAER